MGEGFAHLLLQAGDILVGDGAYSRAKQLLAAAAAQAFSLVRYSPAHLPLYAGAAPAWTREHRLDVPAWLRTLPPGLYQRRAMVVEQEHCLPVRLIALVLPEEQAEALRRQKQRQARDKGRKLSEQARLSSRLCAAGDDPASNVLVHRAAAGALSSQMAD